MSTHYAMCKYDDATGSYIPLSEGMATGFEKWFQIYAPTAPESLDDCALAAFQAGAASRDAEIAELTKQRDDLRDCVQHLVDEAKLTSSQYELCRMALSRND